MGVVGTDTNGDVCASAASYVLADCTRQYIYLPALGSSSSAEGEAHALTKLAQLCGMPPVSAG